jgi:hypothetical protein
MTSIAILIPALNEEQTIAEVVHACQKVAPGARIVVFDNASTDETAARAKSAGAEVRFEPRRGKGNVVQSMFRTIDADVYVMVDGDATYPAERMPDLMQPILDGTADMVIGSRLMRGHGSDFRALNLVGNLFYASLLRSLFGVRLTDLLSGYRAFSRRLVKSLPLVGGGFETEAEMTIKAVHRGFRVVEVPVTLAARPEGSKSKIRIAQDGVLILNAIVALFRDYKPLTFFSLIALVLAAGAGTALFLHAAVVAATLALLAAASASAGAVLHTVTRHFQELETQIQRIIEEPRLSADSRSQREDVRRSLPFPPAKDEPRPRAADIRRE